MRRSRRSEAKEQDSGKTNPEGTAEALQLRDAHEQKLGSHERRRALQDKYEFLHPQDIMHGLMAFGFECGDGWLQILEELFAKIDEIVKRDKLEYFQVVQVKEKFGGLRVYVHGGNKEISNLITEAEKKADKICEVCGFAGETHEIDNWYTTLCDRCKKKRMERDKDK